jgi:hypothetical protein
MRSGLEITHEMPWNIHTRSLEKQGAFPSSTWPLLLRIARAAIDEVSIDRSSIPVNAIGWATLASDADAHGLSPLADLWLKPHREAIPQATMQQLDALALRDRVRQRERTIALAEILQAFERASIDAIVLKGAALAWIIYASPALRPMGDMDLMVPGAAAREAQLSLRRLGFDAENMTERRFGRNAHHLPTASRSQNGVTISIEIHRDALSRDTLSSISLGNLSEPPRSFDMNGTQALALGHVDTLRHLTHHLLEPSWNGRLRLVGLVDLLRYVLKFHDQIDWRRLETSQAFVLNALRCLHHVIPLPAALARFSPPPDSPAPARAGETIRPLRAILAGRRPTAALAELFNPADWWLHAYYGVPAERSLTGVRFGRHPWRVARWLGLRASGF